MFPSSPISSVTSAKGSGNLGGTNGALPPGVSLHSSDGREEFKSNDTQCSVLAL